MDRSVDAKEPTAFENIRMCKMIYCKGLVGLSLAAVMLSSHAALITFEDDHIRDKDKLIPGQVRDLTVWSEFSWSNISYHDTESVVNGFAAGQKTPGGHNVAFNYYGTGGFFFSDKKFTVNSLWAMAGWNQGMTVVFKGYNQDGNVKEQTSITPLVGTSQKYTFNWVDLYKFGFEAKGGTATGQSGGTQVVLDDICVDEPVTGAPPDSCNYTDDTNAGAGNESGNAPQMRTDGSISSLGTNLSKNPNTVSLSGPVNGPSVQSGDVPAPATILLLGLGLGLAGWGPMRRNRKLGSQTR